MGASVPKVPDARDDDFLWVMFEDVVFNNPVLARAENEGTIRRLFMCESPSAEVLWPAGTGGSMLEILFTSLDGSEVADLLPIPWRRALNFRFVAFIAR